MAVKGAAEIESTKPVFGNKGCPKLPSEMEGMFKNRF
jgi:hypothetical protein